MFLGAWRSRSRVLPGAWQHGEVTSEPTASFYERVGGEPTNVLNASIVMDDDGARILSVSEVSGEMNFEGPVGTEPASDGLFLAWDYFSQVVGSTVPA